MGALNAVKTMTSPAGKPMTIAQKARRKISLPWFRQGSMQPSHPALSRQHTIDTPGSFQARLLRRQPSLAQQVLQACHCTVYATRNVLMIDVSLQDHHCSSMIKFPSPASIMPFEESPFCSQKDIMQPTISHAHLSLSPFCYCLSRSVWGFM